MKYKLSLFWRFQWRRCCDKEAPTRTAGPTRGRSYVAEFNPATGQVRAREENYDYSGVVNRVHPKMNNGEILDLPHYPPTKADIAQGISTPREGLKYPLIFDAFAA